MPEIDDVLEQKLREIEDGRPVEEVVSSLPAEFQELAALLKLAATVRTMPHPEPALVKVPVGNSKAVFAIRTPEQAARTARPEFRFQWPHLNLSLLGTVAIFTAIVMLFVIGFWLAGPRNAHAARLDSVTGTVEVEKRGSSQWTGAQEGLKLRQGDSIRTVGASTVTLNFFEGSKTVLAPNTSLTIASIDGRWGNILEVQLNQESGRTSHKVVPFRSSRSFYYVQTPSGRASVHGTSFRVDVQANGKSRFTVSTGRVEVTSDSSQVFVDAGQTASAESQYGLTAPTYQFSTSGTLDQMDGSTWTVGGVSFMVTGDSTILSNPALGDHLTVEGRVLEDGTRVADTISPMTGEEVLATFTGTLEAVNSDSWVINGNTVLVNTDTELSSGLAVGDPVKVTFRVLGDGQWQAVAVEPLIDQPDTPTEEQVTPDPIAKPELEFIPEDLETSGSGTEFSFAGTLWNASGSTEDFASGVKLGYLTVDGSDQVTDVQITPDTFERIDMGQQVNFDVKVTLKEGWADVAKKVKIQIFVAEEANRGERPGKLTLTIEGVPSTTEPSEEPTDGTPGVEMPDESSICDGTKIHPTGMTLAKRYDVDYNEVMSYFCSEPHFGFGEIDLAYTISKETGVDVAEIFQMKSEGKGWGVIRDELGVKPGKPEKTPNPNKPVKPEKPTKEPRPERTNPSGK